MDRIPAEKVSPAWFVEGMPLADRGSPWLGVGATEGLNMLVSTHEPDQVCVGCLHPIEGGLSGKIPTAAFVSLWSSFLMLSRWLRELTAASPAHADSSCFSTHLVPRAGRMARRWLEPMRHVR